MRDSLKFTFPRWSLIIAFALSVAIGRCHAQNQSSGMFGGTAGELMTDCRQVAALDRGDKTAMMAIERCSKYIVGVTDGIAVDKMAHPTDVFFCLPDRISDEELTRVVLKYGEDHPEKLHLTSAVFVVSALTEAYPCRTH